MLTDSRLVAFAATTDFERARHFYEGVLGLRVTAADEFALVFDAAGTMLRVAKVEQVVVAPYTLLGWAVEDIQTRVQGLAAQGVRFQRYPWIAQDDLGVWTTPDGTQVAWFQDPDGNTLSLAQFPD
jgi:catechol 2,3-dioxygenase-like lactoylglutathione lyase family enzyme